MRTSTRGSLVLAGLSFLLAGCPAEPDGGNGMPDPATPATPASGTATATAEPEPEPEPEPLPPFERDTARTPWARAKVGDWALMSLGGGAFTQRWEVIELGNDTVKFAMYRVEEGGKEEHSRDATVKLREEEKKYKAPRTFDAVTEQKEGVPFKIGDHEVKCLVVMREYSGRSTETWFCDEFVFMGGVVRSIKDGSVESEVLDFGSK